MKLIILSTFIFFISTKLTSGQRCNKIARCKCEMSDGSGIVSLEGISLSTANPKFYTRSSTGYYVYDYNPCVGFDSNGFKDLAILQTVSPNLGFYDLGVQSTEAFSVSRRGKIYIQYTAARDGRHSKVELRCNRARTLHKFSFVGEFRTKEYDFVLEGPCACPGGCNSQGIIRGNSNTTTAEVRTTARTTTRMYGAMATRSRVRISEGYYRRIGTTRATRTRYYNHVATIPPQYRRRTYFNNTLAPPVLLEKTHIPSYFQIDKEQLNTNDGNEGTNKPSILKWDVVGYDLVSLLLHDIILFAFVITFILVFIYFFGYKQSCLTKNTERNCDNSVSYAVNT